MPEVIYRIPPFKADPQVLSASDLDEVTDWGAKAFGLEGRWKEPGSDGEGILIGVADSGRPEHPDLDGSVKASKNFSRSQTDLDLFGHAHHVCGIIGARHNGVGVRGVLPKCQLVIAKVLGDDGSGTSGGIAAGIRWQVEQGCHAINLSLGGGFDQAVAEACMYAVQAGVIVVCANGNEGTAGMGFPARLPFVLPVGSFDESGNLSEFSSRGREAFITFPGGGILSCYTNKTYRRMSGTSMAAPFASALIGMRMGRERFVLAGGGTPKGAIKSTDTAKALMIAAAEDRGPAGKDSGWGHGVVDAEKFLDAGTVAKPVPVTPPPGPAPVDVALWEFMGLKVMGRFPMKVGDLTGAFIYIR